jgi:aminoglycoside phosphotransferase (APT) family kinase protein
VSLVVVDDGFDFKVVLVDDRWVVRIPRRVQVLSALEQEVVLLPVLEAALPVAVPHFEHISHDPPFVVYPLILGTPLIDEDPAGVRGFLESLHRVQTDVLPPTDWIASYTEQCAKFEELVFPLLDADDRSRAQALFAEVETLTGFDPCVTHSDLGAEHLLVREGRLVGVIDWGDARLGDPALDYSWLLHGPFPDWEVDPELRRRAGFYHRLAPFFSVHYGVFTKRPAYVEQALAKLRSRL